ncbi:MAG: hypothetical protein ACI9Y1_002257, partial [Lentisphaeria bacterium]
GSTLEENIAVAGDVVATFVASDLDDDDITYSITSGNDDGYFEILNNSKGEVTLTGAGELAIENDGLDLAEQVIGVTANDGVNDSAEATANIVISHVSSPENRDAVISQIRQLASDDTFKDLVNELQENEQLKHFDRNEFYDNLDAYVEEMYPELASHFSDTLGYGVISGVLPAFVISDTEADSLGHQTTFPSLYEELLYRANLPLSDDAEFVSQDVSGDLPEVDPEASYVEFTLLSGNKITFDGAEAGTAANNFARIFENSAIFRDAIENDATENGGSHGFHTYDTWIGEGGTSGHKPGYGTFLNINASNPLLGVIHNVGHELEESHSREHSLFVGQVINQLENNGIDTDANTDFDFDNISNNIRVLDGFRGRWKLDEPEWSQLFIDAKTAMQDGDLDTLEGILSNIDADAVVTADTGFSGGEELSVNARELFIQELVLEADSDDWFNTDKGGEVTANQKLTLATALSNLTITDPSFREAIENASETLNIDLTEEGLNIDS